MEVWNHTFITLAIDWLSGQPHPASLSFCYRLNREVGEPQNRSGRGVGRKIHAPKSEPWSCNLRSNNCTD